LERLRKKHQNVKGVVDSLDLDKFTFPWMCIKFPDHVIALIFYLRKSFKEEFNVEYDVDKGIYVKNSSIVRDIFITIQGIIIIVDNIGCIYYSNSMINEPIYQKNEHIFDDILGIRWNFLNINPTKPAKLLSNSSLSPIIKIKRISFGIWPTDNLWVLDGIYFHLYFFFILFYFYSNFAFTYRKQQNIYS
jgi:hypothetical protein